MPCTKGLVVVFIPFLNIWYTCYCSEGKFLGFTLARRATTSLKIWPIRCLGTRVNTKLVGTKILPRYEYHMHLQYLYSEWWCAIFPKRWYFNLRYHMVPSESSPTVHPMEFDVAPQRFWEVHVFFLAKCFNITGLSYRGLKNDCVLSNTPINVVFKKGGTLNLVFRLFFCVRRSSSSAPTAPWPRTDPSSSTSHLVEHMDLIMFIRNGPISTRASLIWVSWSEVVDFCCLLSRKTTHI